MISSMTAFGRQEASGDWGHAVWEIKTVNHRYLEMTIRLPDDLRVLENKIREQISAKLKRGKADCVLRYEASSGNGSEISINADLANKLISAAESLQVSTPVPINPVDILRWPGVINKETLDPETIGGPLLELLDKTLDSLTETRDREGEKIYQMLIQRCEAANAHVQQIRVALPEILDSIRQRFMSRVQESAMEIDPDRLEQEMLFLAQKMDVAEELDRLEAHLEEVKRVMQDMRPVGRRLDFLMQEMNREANTIGSKAASIIVGNASVELKVLIEQMREQIQNIE